MRRASRDGTTDNGWWGRHAPMIAALAAIASASTAVAAFGGMSAIAVTNGLPSQVIPSGHVPLPPVVVPEPVDPPEPPGAEPVEIESIVLDPPVSAPPEPPAADRRDPTFTMSQSSGHGPTENGRRWVARAPDEDDETAPRWRIVERDGRRHCGDRG